MKKILAVICLFFILVGCDNGGDEMARALKLRDQVLKSEQCSLDATIHAEYGDEVYTFGMRCDFTSDGAMAFKVTKPDSIADITGTVSAGEGHLTFDDKALLFELLVDDMITPVSAPWLMFRLLRSGYISACGKDTDGIHIQIDDSYNGEKLFMDLYTNGEDQPIRADFLWQNRRVVSVVVENFAVK